jgi:hypothetical protein
MSCIDPVNGIRSEDLGSVVVNDATELTEKEAGITKILLDLGNTFGGIEVAPTPGGCCIILTHAAVSSDPSWGPSLDHSVRNFTSHKAFGVLRKHLRTELDKLGYSAD